MSAKTTLCCQTGRRFALWSIEGPSVWLCCTASSEFYPKRLRRQARSSRDWTAPAGALHHLPVFRLVVRKGRDAVDTLCQRAERSADWCPGEDSNLHALRHTDLNRARLPIPPPGQVSCRRFTGGWGECQRAVTIIRRRFGACDGRHEKLFPVAPSQAYPKGQGR